MRAEVASLLAYSTNEMPTMANNVNSASTTRRMMPRRSVFGSIA